MCSRQDLRFVSKSRCMFYSSQVLNDLISLHVQIAPYLLIFIITPKLLCKVFIGLHSWSQALYLSFHSAPHASLEELITTPNRIYTLIFNLWVSVFTVYASKISTSFSHKLPKFYQQSRHETSSMKYLSILFSLPKTLFKIF